MHCCTIELYSSKGTVTELLPWTSDRSSVGHFTPVNASWRCSGGSQQGRACTYLVTSGAGVVNLIMLYWYVYRYRRGEGQKLLKESKERVTSSRGAGHTGAGGDLLSQHSIDL